MAHSRKKRKSRPKVRGGHAQQPLNRERGRQVPTWQIWLSGVIRLYLMVVIFVVVFFVAAIIAAIIPTSPVVQGLVAAGNIVGGMAGMFSVWIAISSDR